MSKVRTVLAVTIVCLAVGAAAEAQPVYRYGFRGDPWIQWRYPDGDSVGQDCFSNCGAGCSDSPNPCGGPQQYWIQEMTGDPQFAGVDYYSDCDERYGTLLNYTAQRYVAPMHENYHGFRTAGCQLHDNTCGGIVWLNPGCWWSPLTTCLIDREERDWAWDTWRDGRLWQVEAIPCGCEVQGDYSCY
jgi:hypothetical protein